MQYFSTRNASERTSPSLALLTGLAPDGGLYVPEELPALFSAGLYSLERRELFARVISALIDDIPYERILAAVDAGYGGKFDTPAFCPVVKAGDTHILELWHGPTCAFKDMALCILPHLMNAAREKNGLKEDLVILTATSGDTGKAALAGFADAPHTKIIVFYPNGGVSELQRLQMVTQRGGNVRVCAVRGNFDDAQRGVKAALEGFKHEGLVASSANSINIGRLAPQTAYYFAAYGDMVANGTIEFGREVDFVVPTGNFGNILAGYMAKRMGLPVGKLICASNANDVLYQFLSEGVYDRASRQLIKTASPSMDILISSNLEQTGAARLRTPRLWPPLWRSLKKRVAMPCLTTCLSASARSSSAAVRTTTRRLPQYAICGRTRIILWIRIRPWHTACMPSLRQRGSSPRLRWF